MHDARCHTVHHCMQSPAAAAADTAAWTTISMHQTPTHTHRCGLQRGMGDTPLQYTASKYNQKEIFRHQEFNLDFTITFVQFDVLRYTEMNHLQKNVWQRGSSHTRSSHLDKFKGKAMGEGGKVGDTTAHAHSTEMGGRQAGQHVQLTFVEPACVNTCSIQPSQSPHPSITHASVLYLTHNSSNSFCCCSYADEWYHWRSFY